MSKKVMVVDDHDGTRISIKSLLNRWGYDVLEAGTEEAIGAMGREDPDLLILDDTSPAMDKREVMETARSNPSKEIPVIALIGADHEQEFSKVCDPERSHYLTKPFSATQLLYGIRLMFGEVDTYWKA